MPNKPRNAGKLSWCAHTAIGDVPKFWKDPVYDTWMTALHHVMKAVTARLVELAVVSLSDTHGGAVQVVVDLLTLLLLLKCWRAVLQF